MMQMSPLSKFRYYLLVTLALSLTTVLGCTMENGKKIYGIEDIRSRIVVDDVAGKFYVVFNTLMETQFYSPGVKVRTDEKNNIFIEFVRSGIQEKNLQVDLKAEYLVKWIDGQNISKSILEKIQNRATSADQIFVLSGKSSGIYVTDGINKKLIWSRSE